MRRALGLTLAAAAAIFAAGCAGGLAPSGRPGPVDRGRAFAEQRCAGCHNVGRDDVGPREGPAFREFAQGFDADTLARRFMAVSAHGSGRMPPVNFGRKQSDDLQAYIASLGG